MGWCTPISDGPLYGGLFLDGFCRRWGLRPSAAAAADARRLARGLVALAECSPVAGFVARCFSEDGRSYYPASSEDQVLPWAYGLWRYWRSPLPDAAEKVRIAGLIRRMVAGIEELGWRVPCDPTAFGFRGHFLGAKHKDAARLLFLNRLLHDLTGDERWARNYRKLALERVGPGPKNRLEWCAEGMEFVNSAVEVIATHETASVSRSLWTSSLAQAALRGLWELEDDPAWRDAYARGLNRNARAARPHCARGRAHAQGSRGTFEVDWRFLNETWRSQVNCDEAIVLARSQLPVWEARSVRSRWEDDTMREPLFAAWIALQAVDNGLRREVVAEVRRLLHFYRWESLFTAGFGIVVGIDHWFQD